MRTTLKFLGEKSGLSIAAVSRILNNKPIRVSDEKKRLVLELAKKYNYRPNMTAVALVTKKTNTIGLILPDIENPFFAIVASELNKFFYEKGYNIILCNLNNRDDALFQYIRMLEEKQVDALIICVSDEKNECDLSVFYEQNIPIVFFDRYYASARLVVSIDNENGAEQAVRHLIDNGHREIAMITGPKNYKSATARINGYKNALRKAGIKINDNLIIDGGYTFEGGVEAAKKIIAQKCVTAIFASNDLMAYGAIKAMSENSLRVPDDISIVGFDDLLYSQMLGTPLTSIRQNVDELAQNVFDLTIVAMKSGLEDTHRVVQTKLVMRDSVKNIVNRD